jgi:hypothetical protein
MTELSAWEKKALGALRAYDAAVGQLGAARRSRATGLAVDPDRAALDGRVRAHMTGHPGVSYADALEAVTGAPPPEEPSGGGQFDVDAERQALHERVITFAADH